VKYFILGVVMQEISPHVYIDSSYAGVTLGAINWTHGLILVDAPFRPDDIRSWRAALLNLGGGIDRLLINLDAHFDRTLGVRVMDSTIVAHEKVADIFRNRPVSFKVQNAETGADWELYNGLGSIRWASPDLTFSDSMTIHWDNSPISLEYHPGPASGAIWVVLTEYHVAFIGDAVVPGQPPFLASADLPIWINNLNELLQPAYSNTLLVSGRGGLVTQEDVSTQLNFLQKAHKRLEELAEQKVLPEETERLVPELLQEFQIPEQFETHYRQRLRWGLFQYYARHYRQMNVDADE
jgi:cyclase